MTAHAALCRTCIGNTAASLDRVSASIDFTLQKCLSFLVIGLTKLAEAAAEGLHLFTHEIASATTKTTPPN